MTNWFYDVLPIDIQDLIWRMIEREGHDKIMATIKKLAVLKYQEDRVYSPGGLGIDNRFFDKQVERQEQRVGYASSGYLVLWRLREHTRQMVDQCYTVNLAGERVLVSEKPDHRHKYYTGYGYRRSRYDPGDYTNRVFTWHGSSFRSGGATIDTRPYWRGIHGLNSRSNVEAMRFGMAGWCCENSREFLTECCKKNGVKTTGTKGDIVRRLWKIAD
jgi:hypothetical protein